MDQTLLKKLRQQAHTLSATVQIGKAGLTPTIVDELANQLKKRNLVKLKFLPSAFSEHPSKKEKQAFAAQLAEKVGAEIIQQIGFVVVLYKPRKDLIL
ncbi:MAG: YhbY family RNA-binding protein [Candidatus Woesearchaeota archaeon]|nr:YhbY family RNA-binding protein [Candidatus Woesearchaeota archaeon]